jgi:hypothetical protein
MTTSGAVSAEYNMVFRTVADALSSVFVSWDVPFFRTRIQPENDHSDYSMHVVHSVS